MLVYLVTNSKTMDFGTNRIQSNPSRRRSNTLLDSGLNDFGKVISISAGIAFYNLSLKLQQFNSTMICKYDLLSSILKYSASKRLFSTKIKRFVNTLFISLVMHTTNIKRFVNKLLIPTAVFTMRLRTPFDKLLSVFGFRNCLLSCFVWFNNPESLVFVENTLQYPIYFNLSGYFWFNDFICLVGLIVYIFLYVYALTILRAVVTYINEFLLSILARDVLIILIITVIANAIFLLNNFNFYYNLYTLFESTFFLNKNIIISFIIISLLFKHCMVLFFSQKTKPEIIPNQKSDGTNRLTPSQPNSDDNDSVFKKLKKKWNSLTTLQKTAIIAAAGTGLYLIYHYFSGSASPPRDPHFIRTTPINLIKWDNLFCFDTLSSENLNAVRQAIIEDSNLSRDTVNNQYVIKTVFDNGDKPFDQKRLFTFNTRDASPEVIRITESFRKWLAPSKYPGNSDILNVLYKNKIMFGLDDIGNPHTLYYKYATSYNSVTGLYQYPKSCKFYLN
jgi:hypothetical protein